MEKTRKQLVATVAAMLGDQYKVSISIRHFEESLKEFDSTYFIEIVKKAAEDSLVPVIALDPFVKAVNQNEISMNRAASVIINLKLSPRLIKQTFRLASRKSIY